MTLEAQILF